MELEMNDVLGSLSVSMERLSAAASALEITAARLEEREAAISGDVQKITAAVETGGDMVRRELERKLAAAQQEIAVLLAQGAAPQVGPGLLLQSGLAQSVAAQAASMAVRKTVPAATVQLLAKQGIDSLDTMDLGTLDAALSGLGIEQRLAVKSQLLRSGTLIA